jgi:hypothetical protein
MAFSFADFGFWRLAIITFAYELLHAILENYWPEIRGSRLGPRTPAARCFMLFEALVLMATLIAAIDNVIRSLKPKKPNVGKACAVIVSALSALGLFLLVWGR